MGGTVTEGNSGTRTLTFTVTLSAASDAPVSVDYATADGDATVAGGDYLAKSGTLTFAPGETSKTFTVTVKGDRLGESDESFLVNLVGAAGARHRLRDGLRDHPRRRAPPQRQQREPIRRVTAARR